MLDGEEDEGDGKEDGGCFEGVSPVEQGEDARGRVGLVTSRFGLDRATHHNDYFRFLLALERGKRLIWKERG